MGQNKYLKGFLQDIVLRLIEKKGEMYGYQITKEVQEISEGAITVTEGALYPILHKLENSGLLSVDYRMYEGRTRKYYALTNDGKKSNVEIAEDMELFLKGLKNIFNPKLANG